MHTNKKGFELLHLWSLNTKTNENLIIVNHAKDEYANNANQYQESTSFYCISPSIITYLGKYFDIDILPNMY